MHTFIYIQISIIAQMYAESTALTIASSSLSSLHNQNTSHLSCQFTKMSKIYGHAQQLMINIETKRIAYVAMVFAHTQAGSTTACHCLTHRILRSREGKFGKWCYQIAHQKPDDMRIGTKRGVSETEAVNIFESDVQIEEGDQTDKLYLIDPPGIVIDSPIDNSLRNPLLKSIIFERVNNIKFIIVFRYTDMGQAAQLMLTTFIHFFNMFDHVEQILEELVPSVCVLVVDVPNNIMRAQVLEEYGETPGLPSRCQYHQAYSYLKSTLIHCENLYIFPSASTVPTADPLDATLMTMHNNTKFWNRNLLADNKICMKSITNIHKTITTNKQLSTAQMKQIKAFYNEVVRQKINDLTKILKNLIQNCGSSTDDQFLTMMKQKGKQYYDKNILSLGRSAAQVNKRRLWYKSIFDDDGCVIPMLGEKQLEQFGISRELQFGFNKIEAFGRIDELARDYLVSNTSRQQQQHFEAFSKTVAILFMLIRSRMASNPTPTPTPIHATTTNTTTTTTTTTTPTPVPTSPRNHNLKHNPNSNPLHKQQSSISYEQYFLYEIYCSAMITNVWLTKTQTTTKYAMDWLVLPYKQDFNNNLKLVFIRTIYKEFGGDLEMFIMGSGLSVGNWMAIVARMPGIRSKFVQIIKQRRAQRKPNKQLQQVMETLTDKQETEQIHEMLELIHKMNPKYRKNICNTPVSLTK